ncbi:MAG: MCE family protein [Rhodospirillaceae bacterium]|nr:MCE family protein [Rhodospirillaceae bacterium]MYB12735.1 MCE family protein [Rhodospirillaceae bacterium]MYI49474.1 MCE family protein [Rhodospirillaceae bacterium]
MRENRTVLALTGALAIALILLGMVFGLAAGDGARRGYLLHATYDQADGLAVGAPVYLAGVRVGVVERMSLDPRRLRARVALRIDEAVGVPEESAAMIVSDGVLGGKSVKIEPGSGENMMAKGSEFELVQDAVIVESLLERIVEAAAARRTGAGR